MSHLVVVANYDVARCAAIDAYVVDRHVVCVQPPSHRLHQPPHRHLQRRVVSATGYFQLAVHDVGQPLHLLVRQRPPTRLGVRRPSHGSRRSAIGSCFYAQTASETKLRQKISRPGRSSTAKIGEIDDQLAQKRRQIWQLVNSSQATPLKAALKQRKSFENAASQRQPERRRAYCSLGCRPPL